LHFSQTLASLAALTQQGWAQGLLAFSALSQQPPVLYLEVSTAGAAGASLLAGAAVVDAAIASEEQTVTRARRRKRCFMMTVDTMPAQVASRSLGLPGAEQADDCPHPDQSRHGELLPVEHPSGYRRNEHE